MNERHCSKALNDLLATNKPLKPRARRGTTATHSPGPPSERGRLVHLDEPPMRSRHVDLTADVSGAPSHDDGRDTGFWHQPALISGTCRLHEMVLTHLASRQEGVRDAVASSRSSARVASIPSTSGIWKSISTESAVEPPRRDTAVALWVLDFGAAVMGRAQGPSAIAPDERPNVTQRKARADVPRRGRAKRLVDLDVMASVVALATSRRRLVPIA